MTQLSENALAIARDRYFINDEEDWEGLSKRVGREIGRVESDNNWIDKFSQIIYDMEFLPGGRILRNAGRQKGSCFNCVNVPVEDSIESIGEWIKNCLIHWSNGSGVGTNIGTLRGKGFPIRGKGGTSTGSNSFLEAANAAASTIESGGSRRAAGLACMPVSHPDVLDFIDAKVEHGTISHFNISVIVDEDFLAAVEQDDIWKFKFSQKEYGEIRARELWDKIMVNMVEHSEPGLLNKNNFFSNNSYYFAPISSPNACSEATLDEHGVCCLGSLVLSKFIKNVNTDWVKMEQVIRLGIRFLDNVLDASSYTLQENKASSQNSRRIGIGVMGLAEYLFAKRLRYGSQESLREIERLMKFIRDVSYDESINLSIEKGSFPKFDPIQYGKAHFIRTLPASTRLRIKENGIRNCTTIAIAPTGTISLLPDVTSAIEPLFSKAYRRDDRVGSRIYLHPIYKALLESGEPCPDWMVDTSDLTAQDHLSVQALCGSMCDASVSKTINCPKGTTANDLSKLLLEYIHDLKGVTVYVDGAREGQILNHISEQEARDFLATNVESAPVEVVQCASGKCDL